MKGRAFFVLMSGIIFVIFAFMGFSKSIHPSSELKLRAGV